MESVIFEVTADDITDVLGNGIALPRGKYPGVIEWRTLALGGHSQPYIAMAKLFISAPQLATLGLQNLADVWCPVATHVKSGKIAVIEVSGPD